MTDTRTESKEPNSITRAIIDATVDRGLSDIEEDPKRSIRKLTDMGRLFNKGRFMDDIYGMVQDLLRNDDSPYYSAIETLLRSTSRQNIKGFGINFGYSGFTFGGHMIRELTPSKDFYIPWQITVRLDSSNKNSLSVNELDNLIRQGRTLGIYVYMIRIIGSDSYLEDLTKLMRHYTDCAFMVILPDRMLSAVHLDQIRQVTNAMFLFPAETASAAANIQAMRKQKSLYGVYAVYTNQDASEWYSGQRVQSLAQYSAMIALLISDDCCSQRSCQRVAKYCKNARLHPEYPMVLFDLIGDSLQIDRIVSDNSNNIYFELLENGDLKTKETIISDFRHTISLDTILRIAFPKTDE